MMLTVWRHHCLANREDSRRSDHRGTWFHQGVNTRCLIHAQVQFVGGQSCADNLTAPHERVSKTVSDGAPV
jgi:hypothetical protein